MNPEVAYDAPDSQAPRRLQLDDLVVDETLRSISRGGQSRQLTNLTWEFLAALLRAAPEPASHEQLARQVWGRDQVSDETMAQRVRQLRNALGDDPRQPRYIRTLGGVGYQLIPPVLSAETASKRNRPALPAGNTWAISTIFTPTTIGVIAVVGLAAAALVLWSPPEPRERAIGLPTTDPVAERVQRADQYRNQFQPDSNSIAVTLYQDALAKDPDNSRAWAARGLAADVSGQVSNAVRYYQRALSLDPNNQSARTSLAHLLQVQGQLHLALQADATALGAAPATEFAGLQIARALSLAGLDEPAAAWLQRVATLQPDNLFLPAQQAQQLMAQQRWPDALVVLDQAQQRNAQQLELRALALLALDRVEAAAAAFAEAARQAAGFDQSCLPCLAWFAASQAPGPTDSPSDNQATLQAQIQTQLDTLADGDEWPAFRVDLATMHLAGGNADAAIQALQEAQRLGYRDWRWLQASPLLAPLQQDPRFLALVQQMQGQVEAERQAIAEDPDLAVLLQL